MLSKSKAHVAGAGSCIWCHKGPFLRTVHLLQRLDGGNGYDEIRRHLAVEFPHQAAEFHSAEIRSVEFVRQYYGREIDEEGRPLPAWVAWQLNKCSSMAIARLWKMADAGSWAPVAND